MGIQRQRSGAIGMGDSGRPLGQRRIGAAHHQGFKSRVVAGLPEQEWVLTSDDVSQALQAIFKNDLEGPAVFQHHV
jgi:hypothetical protein